MQADGLQLNFHNHGFEWRFECNFTYSNKKNQKNIYIVAFMFSGFCVRSLRTEVEKKSQMSKKSAIHKSKAVHQTENNVK